MCHIIDRRLNGRNKSAVNRQRFLRRYKAQIREAVAQSITGRSITEKNGERIDIPARDIGEPSFRHGHGGRRVSVHPGNREFVAGERLPRPQGGAGGGGSQAGKDGSSEDSFGFELSREEFLALFFEDLELPDLNKTQIERIPDHRYVHAGHTRDGVPANLDVVRSLRGALARRIAMQGPARRLLEEAVRARGETDTGDDEEPPAGTPVSELDEHIAALRRRIAAVPFLDSFDLRYRNKVRQPVPRSQAVMFCLMDVSASMDERRKDMAKRFFTLLYLFLTRAYEHIQVVFIRHHTVAVEVGEDEFFHSRESGGTVVSSALALMDEIIAARYPAGAWNVYGAQASDGDNWGEDCARCATLLRERILPRCQYYAYVQIDEQMEQGLWREYAAVQAEVPVLAMRKIGERADIYPVFRDLLTRREHA